MIEIRNLSKIYNKGKINEFAAVKNISLTINSSEMVAIVGKSGAGKSTLLHVIGCIDNFDSGSYLFNRIDISKIKENKRADIRNKDIGIVLQDFALVEDYTAIENVMIPLYFTKRKGIRNKKETALAALDKIGIQDLADKKVNKLSGGQKQRVAIARAIVNEPDILLADEPTGALDVNTSKEIMNVFKKLNKGGMSIVIITHDIDIANECERTIEICDGKILD